LSLERVGRAFTWIRLAARSPRAWRSGTRRCCHPCADAGSLLYHALSRPGTTRCRAVPPAAAARRFRHSTLGDTLPVRPHIRSVLGIVFSTVANTSVLAQSHAATRSAIANVAERMGVARSRPLLDMTLDELRATVPKLQPQMAGFEHQLWGVRAADSRQVTFAVASDATTEETTIALVVGAELSLASSSRGNFLRLHSAVLRSLAGLAVPQACKREVIAIPGKSQQVTLVNAQWFDDDIGLAYSARVPQRARPADESSGSTVYRLHVKIFHRSDVALAPTMPRRSDVPCVLTESDLRALLRYQVCSSASEIRTTRVLGISTRATRRVTMPIAAFSGSESNRTSAAAVRNG
jgi:hypothetical protein